MLETTSLSKSYGSVVAVRDVSLHLEPGQVLGYLGPNGSGKSTTVKMLTGLLEPTRGQILYNNENIHKNSTITAATSATSPKRPTSIPT